MYKSIMLKDYGDSINFRRYWKLIEYRKTNKPSESNVVEWHHIMPRSLYPDFLNDVDNLVCLTSREHFISHWLLAKITNTNKMWFAFNQMKRVSKSSRSILYQYAREHISKAISEANKGYVHSQKMKDNMSRITSGMVVVKDKDGATFRVSIEDDRYKNGELVFYRTGFRHKEETIEKMKSNNFISGKILCHDPLNHESRGYYDECPEGWITGESPLIKEKISNKIKGMAWFHNPITKKSNRYYIGEEPEGYKRGRIKYNNNGFKKANSMTNVVDLVSRKVSKVENVDKSIHAPQSATTTDKTIIIVYDSKIYSSCKQFNKMTGLNINRNFLLECLEKDFNELNGKEIMVYNLSNFNINQHIDKEIAWII